MPQVHAPRVPKSETARDGFKAAASPRTESQSRLFQAVHDSPRQAAQRQTFARLFGPTEAATSEVPQPLRAGIEALSGVSLAGVRVRSHSPAPARIGALAFAQGREIHLGPGQERHLPHEAWHVAQQAQGRVRPTRQLKGMALNDDAALEREADEMGAKAQRWTEGDPTGLAARAFPVLGHSTVQRNAFLRNLADANGQIDYAQISSENATSNQGLLFGGVRDCIEKNRRNQGLLEALDLIDARFFDEFTNFIYNKNDEIDGKKVPKRIKLQNFVSAGQDIRSSHSGGAIDPNLPQPAYEDAPVAGPGAASVVSVAPPALDSLSRRANYDWLKDSTTDHTTDPDQPALRGPRANGGPKPTLGSIVDPGRHNLLGQNLRLPPAPDRVASYIELSGKTISRRGEQLVTGTRVVYDPFGGRYFVSEHYDQQFEL